MTVKISNHLLPTTQRTGFIPAHRKDFEIGIKRVVNEKTANERLPSSQDQFENLSGLNQAYLPGHNSQDTDLASGWDEILPRGHRHHTSQAGASGFGMKDTRLSFELNRRTEYIRFTCKETGIIQKVLRREVV